MTSLNLFDTMEEFSLQQEDYLGEAFQLSADMMAADLGSEGSILDLEHLNQYNGFKPQQQAAQQYLEDLLLPETVGDSFGEDWMETVDINSLLNESNSTISKAPVISVPPIVPDVKPEPPRQEGMNASAFELLKALLTGTVTEPKLPLPLAQPVVSVPVSPEALVPEMPFFTDSSFDILLNSENESGDLSIEDLIEIQPEISLDNGDIVEIKPQITLYSSEDVQQSMCYSNITSPMSNSDLESLLSGPSSPADSSITLYTTIDNSQLDESNDSFSDKGSQISDNDFTIIKSTPNSQKSKKEKSRSTPYDVDPVYLDKKDRKKVQNKNAATRYRVKKKTEKETLGQQETRLTDKNKELKEKVDSLTREITYMKELMTEINKAKRSKI